jgi:hypothetical protein
MTKSAIHLLLYCPLLAVPSFFPISAQTPQKESTATKHQQWAELLEKHVDGQGNVSYALFRNDLRLLDEYLDYMALQEPREDWSRAEVMAYYINLYNAATVRLILEHYPVASIRDTKQPWARKWIRVGDRELSLNQIEHRILRKMDEPRIHFAINCASASCPKLLNVPFMAQNIDEQLEKAAREFINDPAKNQISREKIAVSALFKWYKNDFTKEGSLLDYIDKYTDLSIPENAKVQYLKYDWSLNDQ